MTTICRTCLIETTDSIDLAQTLFINGEDIDICNMLSICTGLEVQEFDDDGQLPHQICVDCINQTSSSYTFRQNVLQSNRFLKESQTETMKMENDEIVQLEIEEFNEYKQEDQSVDYLVEFDEQEIEYLEDSTTELEEHLVFAETKTEESIANQTKNVKQSISQPIRKPRKKYIRNEAAYVCPFCDKVCRGTGNFHVHVRTHTGEKPYKCDLCNYKCGHPTALKLHIASHSSEKPLVCPYEGCTKAYKIPSQLTEHRRVHEPPQFQCTTCFKKFHKKVSYNDHIKIHDFDKYIKCDFCDKKFAKRDSVRKHQQNVHKEKYEELKRLILLQSK